MIFVAISDLHGELPKPNELPEGDYLLISGDVCDEIPKLGIEYQHNWWFDKFIPWVNSLPYYKVIMVGGNHDGLFKMRFHSSRNQLEYVSNPTKCKLIYLEDELYTTYEGIKIYGTPHCRKFGTWYFMSDQVTLSEIYDRMPEDVDILLCHDAPYGCSDICLQYVDFNPDAYKKHLGNEALREVIVRKKPKYVLHGHLHSANHNEEILGESKVYCVSILDEEYKSAYQPLILEL